MRYLPGFFALIVLLASSHPTIASPRLGVAVLRPDSTGCVTFRNELRKPGDHLLLILFSPARIVDGVITGPSEESCKEAADQEAQGYVCALRYPISNQEEVGVAIYDPTARAEYSDGEFLVYTQGARAPLRLRQCFSHEGLHLTAWRDNRRTWHEYWYLGFELEPNCTEEEVAP